MRTMTRRRDLEQAVIAAAREVADGGDTDDGMVEVKWDEMIHLRDALDNLDKLREVEKPRTAKVAPVTSHYAVRWIQGPDVQSTMLHQIFYRIWWTTRHNSGYPTMNGQTVDELEARLDRPHQTVSARVNELANAGWIIDSGHTRKTRRGTEAIVWIPSAAAREAVNAGYSPEVT